MFAIKNKAIVWKVSKLIINENFLTNGTLSSFLLHIPHYWYSVHTCRQMCSEFWKTRKNRKSGTLLHLTALSAIINTVNHNGVEEFKNAFIQEPLFKFCDSSKHDRAFFVFSLLLLTAERSTVNPQGQFCLFSYSMKSFTKPYQIKRRTLQ